MGKAMNTTHSTIPERRSAEDIFITTFILASSKGRVLSVY
jgi:hypothetical protein